MAGATDLAAYAVLSLRYPAPLMVQDGHPARPFAALQTFKIPDYCNIR